MRRSNRLGIAACALLLTGQLGAQVTYERILDADKEPGNWLTYNRTYDSRHHSPLDEINRENATELELKWGLPSQVTGKVRIDGLGSRWRDLQRANAQRRGSARCRHGS